MESEWTLQLGSVQAHGQLACCSPSRAQSPSAPRPSAPWCGQVSSAVWTAWLTSAVEAATGLPKWPAHLRQPSSCDSRAEDSHWARNKNLILRLRRPAQAPGLSTTARD